MSDQPSRPTPYLDDRLIHLEPWDDGDLSLLAQLNAPEMMAHLGGPESAEQLAVRHQRYVVDATSDTDCVFRITVGPDGVPVGMVAFWDREWRGNAIYEMGWSVLPEHQGRGIATRAVADAITIARATARRSAIHAFPAVDNAASNGICRKLGFVLVEECTFEYPKGHWMRCNDWRLPLLSL